MPLIADEPMANPLESGRLFVGNLDHAARPLPQVAHDWPFRLQVVVSFQPEALHHAAKSRKGRVDGLGDAAERAALVTKAHGLLLLTRIERPPLIAAIPPSIRQGWISDHTESCEQRTGRALTAAIGFCMAATVLCRSIRLAQDYPFFPQEL